MKWTRSCSVYAAATSVVILTSLSLFCCSALSAQIAMRKTWNCFVGWQGLLLALSLMIVFGVVARPACRATLARMSLPTISVFLLGMLILDIWAGIWCFETSGFYHSMWRWGTYKYIQTAGENMLWSFPLTAVVILAARPWRLVPAAGLLRVLSGAWALFILNYVIAFLAYVTLQSYELE